VAGLQNFKVLLQQQQQQQAALATPELQEAGPNNPAGPLRHATVARRTAKQAAGFGRQSDHYEPPTPEPSQVDGKQKQTQPVCLTPGCVKAAAEILKNLDDKVDPCDDFYRYSCGNWIDSQVIPEDKTSVSLFSVVQDELDNKLRNLIEREPSPQDGAIIGGMRNLYDSCMNTTLIEQLGNEPLVKIIRQLGGWPVLGQRHTANQREPVDEQKQDVSLLAKFNWLDMLIKFRQMGFSHDILIDLSVTPDFRNNTRHIIDVSRGGGEREGGGLEKNGKKSANWRR